MADSSSIQPTIAGIVSQSGDGFDHNNQDFDILREAVEVAGLGDALNDPNADITVFAPTDGAFVNLAQDFGYEGNDEGEALDTITNALSDLNNGDPVPLLEDILLYHVSPGAKDQDQLRADGEVNTLLEDATFTVQDDQLIDNEPDLTDPSFINDLADVQASNGTIQGIDRVLIPLDIPGNDSSNPVEATDSTIAGVVSQSGEGFDDNSQDFDILREAVEVAGLGDALNDPNADLTVFAPTDGAFVNLAQDFGYEGNDEGEALDTITNALSDLNNGDPVPLLEDILLYHVSPGAKDQEQLRADGDVNTLLEDASFTVQGDHLVDNEPDLANPSFISDLADVQTTNGTIQGIDRVLIPIDIPGNESLSNNGGGDDITGSDGNSNPLFGQGDNDILTGFGEGGSDDIIPDSFGELTLSLPDDLSLGNLNPLGNSDLSLILGGENILGEVAGVSTDLLNTTASII